MNHRRATLGCALLVSALALTGCDALGADTTNPTPAASAGAGAPEKSQITISVLPLPDTAPLYYAMEQGYFRDAGLTVTKDSFRKKGSGADTAAAMISGEVDFAFSSWTPLLLAQSKGVADLRLVTNSTNLADGNSQIVTMAHSRSVRTVRDLAGKRIAISAVGTISQLLTESVLTEQGVNPDTIQWVELPFPQISAALIKGDIDAAYLPEPFLTSALKQGATPLYDTNTGGTHALPLSGYAVTAGYLAQHPRTVAAFQHAMQRATNDLQVDKQGGRREVVRLAQAISGVDANTAELASFNDFVPTLDPTTMQRVVDLMVRFKALGKAFGVGPMIVPTS